MNVTSIICPRCGVKGIVCSDEETPGMFQVAWRNGHIDWAVSQRDLSSGDFGCGYDAEKQRRLEMN